MKRRSFLLGALGLGVGAAAYPYWPDAGFWNPCFSSKLPAHLQEHDFLAECWEGIDPRLVWDCHVHLAGVGDNGSGVWISPKFRSFRHPIQSIQFQFYLNAACVELGGEVDDDYIHRLLALHDAYPSGAKLMLLAFDHHYTESGDIDLERSTFYVPNAYAARLARRWPERLRWIASIHPYREDCVEVLKEAIANGAQAVKWLPPAMGMNPASPLCDRFYDALVRYNVPLLTHGGHEHAVDGAEAQALGNPLLLRRPLERGVRVIVAHCATQGSNVDVDAKNRSEKRFSNFELFSRLMDETAYRDRLFGELSAITQINRVGAGLRVVIEREDWHARLLNGSDYPLPGVMPLFSMNQLVAHGLLRSDIADFCSRLRRYNPLLADFVIKRHLQVDQRRLSTSVFESARIFKRDVSVPHEVHGGLL